VLATSSRTPEVVHLHPPQLRLTDCPSAHPPPALGLLSSLLSPRRCRALHSKGNCAGQEAGAGWHVSFQSDWAQGRHSVHTWLALQSPGPPELALAQSEEEGGQPGDRAGQTEAPESSGSLSLQRWETGLPHIRGCLSQASPGCPCSLKVLGRPLDLRRGASPNTSPVLCGQFRVFQGFGLASSAVFQHIPVPIHPSRHNPPGVTDITEGKQAWEEMEYLINWHLAPWTGSEAHSTAQWGMAMISGHSLFCAGFTLEHRPTPCLPVCLLPSLDLSPCCSTLKWSTEALCSTPETKGHSRDSIPSGCVSSMHLKCPGPWPGQHSVAGPSIQWRVIVCRRPCMGAGSPDLTPTHLHPSHL
jgi:hypothetical protein